MGFARLLTAAELSLYRDHLFRLNAEDRRLRFNISLDDAAIAAFVKHISPWDTQIIAQFDYRLAVIAAVQITVVDGPVAELALAVDEAKRGQGLAMALMRRGLLSARNRNIPVASMHFLMENEPARRVARHAGMTVTTLQGESEGYRDLPPASVLSIASEIGAEQLGLLDYLVKAARYVSPPMPFTTTPRLHPQP
jgi:GNAT superfamily N-acetyltransferase